jgi:hypothetical protein
VRQAAGRKKVLGCTIKILVKYHKDFYASFKRREWRKGISEVAGRETGRRRTERTGDDQVSSDGRYALYLLQHKPDVKRIAIVNPDYAFGQGLAPALALEYARTLGELKRNRPDLAILVTKSTPALLDAIADETLQIERGEIM